MITTGDIRRARRFTQERTATIQADTLKAMGHRASPVWRDNHPNGSTTFCPHFRKGWYVLFHDDNGSDYYVCAD